MKDKKVITETTGEDKLPAIPRSAFSVMEIADTLGISRSTVYEAMRSGALHFVKVGARRLVPAASLKAMLEKTSGGEE